MWPFGEFEYAVESICEIAAAPSHDGNEPGSYMFRIGERDCVTSDGDMTNTEELLSALQAAVASRGTNWNDDAATSKTA